MNSLKRMVNTPDMMEAFNEFLNERLRQTQRGLEQAIDLPSVYRLQGQITVLRRMLSLREEINSLDK
jgi:CRP-like cAMP-binding protein